MKGNAGNHPAKFVHLQPLLGRKEGLPRQPLVTRIYIAEAHILTWAENPRHISTTVCHLFPVSFDSEALSILPRDAFSLRDFSPDQKCYLMYTGCYFGDRFR
jgi:hypothetical protein